jgi:HAD superfamily hydrolase (TIGR01450 family)
VSLLEHYDTLLLDLDGVVYRGAGPVVHAVEALASAAEAGVRLGFVTNNASRTPDVVADHLASIGVPATKDQVVTSAQVGAELLARQLDSGSRVLAVGGPGVAAALSGRGFIPVLVSQERQDGRSDAEIASSVAGVLQGFGPAVDWRDLTVTSYAVARGAVWVATNTDQTIPRADGIAPGNGTLVAVVTAATGVVPPSAGKPVADMMQIAAARLGAVRPLVVGDRLDTDIRGAAAAGFDSLLVLTGVSGVEDLLQAPAGDRPTFVGDDLRCLTRSCPRLDDPASEEPLAHLVRQAWAGAHAASDQAVRRIKSLLSV